jgi:transcriptional regulator with XRE-family HTH domain
MIREERRGRGMTLRELARRVGMTPSHLSKIERELANPSVGALWMISDELGIPMADFFAGEHAGSADTQPSQARVFPPAPAGEASLSSSLFTPAVDPEERESIKMAGVEFLRLTPHDDATIEFMEVRHEVGAGDAEPYRHRGREYGLVLKGRLLAEIGFGKYILDPGWSIAFDSSSPHRVLNVGDEPAVAVWVVIGRNSP